MFLGTNFSYNGISGQDMFGLMNVRVGESGLIEQNFGIKRKSLINKVKNKSKVYSYGTEDEVLTFELQLAKESIWTYEQKAQVTQWLIQDRNCDFESEDYPLIYKCKCVGKPVFYNTGNNEGYIKLNMECDSSHAYSPVSIMNFDLSNNPEEGTIIEIYNKGNIFKYYKPEIEISLTGADTSFSITNLTDNNRLFGYNDLSINENIYTDCENERIYSELNDTRYNNLIDGQFLRLIYGLNRIRVIGKMNLEIRCQFPMVV